MASFAMPFSSLVCMDTKHLATKHLATKHNRYSYGRDKAPPYMYCEMGGIVACYCPYLVSLLFAILLSTASCYMLFIVLNVHSSTCLFIVLLPNSD